MKIGAAGLAEVDLVIPQGTTLAFEVTHTDEDGQTIDHSASTAALAIAGNDGAGIASWDSYVTCSATVITVSVPASATAALPLGKMLWDLMVSMANGQVLRLAYGACTVVDTYALDGE